MLEKKIINIAVHGVGTIGKRHLMAINENQNVNLSGIIDISDEAKHCLLYTSPSPRDATLSRMPSSA